MAELLTCYNKGCGEKFDPKENKEDSCRYHAGGPIFHDALKGWSCCGKKSTDFTEFLNTPGCTVGFHSNEKPPEPEKQAKSNGEIDIAEVAPIRAPIQAPPPRPSEKEPLIRLPITVGATLKQALEKQMKDMSLTDKKKDEKSDGSVKIGESCKNNACKGTYQGEGSDTETCLYHPGCPIFHEGMKYWSCCQRKTSDFDGFLNQEGCEIGKHLWHKKDDGKKKVACRYDWHQTGNFVIISVFAKVANPECSWVEANQVLCRVNISFDQGRSLFEKDLLLKQAIDPSKSTVKMLGTKVEINLRKAEPGSWRVLELPPTVVQPSSDDEAEELDDDILE